MWRRCLMVTVAVTLGAGCVDIEEQEFVGEEEVSVRSAQFFSQKWYGDDKLGHCSETIAQIGCAVTATAMAMTALGADVDPATLDAYLTKNGGYDENCNIRWKVAAAMDGPGGVVYVHEWYLSSPEAIRSGLDEGKKVVVKSTRYDQHWVYLADYDGGGDEWSDFIYWDPMDPGPQNRRVGDGWVDGGAPTRVYHH